MVANGRQATERGGAFDRSGDLVHVGGRIEGAGVFALYAQAVDGLELRAHADQVLPGHDVDVLPLHLAQLGGGRTGLGLGLGGGGADEVGAGLGQHRVIAGAGLARIEQYGALGGNVRIALGLQIRRLGNDVLSGGDGEVFARTYLATHIAGLAGEQVVFSVPRTYVVALAGLQGAQVDGVGGDELGVGVVRDLLFIQ